MSSFSTRYERQTLLPMIGEHGQNKLASSVVTVCGCGGLGSPVLTYLACAGLGTLNIVDYDTVSVSNLNRQHIHGEDALGKAKVISAASTLSRLNSSISIKPIEMLIDDTTIDALIQGSDAVIDCTDNIPARLTINKGCLRQDIPLIEGGINGFTGFVLCVDRKHACLGCLGYERAVRSGPLGVIGATAGVIGALQALECIKLITGCGENLFGTLLQYDGLRSSFERITVHVYEKCVCHAETPRSE